LSIKRCLKINANVLRSTGNRCPNFDPFTQGLDQTITIDDPVFGKYRATCHMEVSDYKRGCHDCPNYARAFIHFLAMGWDSFRMGFEVFMLSEDKKMLYSLSKNPVHDSDDYYTFIRA